MAGRNYMKEKELIQLGFKKKKSHGEYWFELSHRGHKFITNDTFINKGKDSWFIGYSNKFCLDCLWFNKRLKDSTTFRVMFKLLTGSNLKIQPIKTTPPDGGGKMKVMDNAKVIKVNEESIVFDNGATLRSEHEQDCCEQHYLSFRDLTISDFEGLEFDLSSDDFFRRIKGYGIELIPVNGYTVKVPAYGYNNGYYSDNLSLVLENTESTRTYDISECQEIND